jgi:glycosyltransferase involved in cell wall biosynthesis
VALEHHEQVGGAELASAAHVADETRALGRQYGREYFEEYGRGPASFQTAAPYRLGEPYWERYFGQIADLIKASHGPRTVLDAGCAIGFLVKALRERDVEAWGIDISEYAIRNAASEVRRCCSVASVTDELARDYDLVVCIEVLEHLPPHLAPPTIANFARHTDTVLFSASPDGYRDPTHQNVQPTDYWVELFGRHGFFRDFDVDASVVSPQAMMFVRAGQTAATVARSYERWHWTTLSELRELRAAREESIKEFRRAERAIEEIAELNVELEEQRVVAEANQAAAARAVAAESELARLQQTRTFRYTAPARALYGRLLYGRLSARRLRRPARRKAPQLAVQYAIDAPSPGQIVARDALLPVHGWVVLGNDAVSAVTIAVNGIDCGRARLGLTRADAAPQLDHPDAIISGFESLVDLSTVPIEAEEIVFDLGVESLAGTRHRFEPVKLRLGSPPVRTHWAHRESGSKAIRGAAGSGAIRLLAFTHHLGLGGGQLYLFELLRLLAGRPQFEATVVAPFDGPLREPTEALGIPVVVNGPHPVESLERYEQRQTDLERWVRDEGFNAILGNTFGAFPGIDLAERLGVPSVWAIHESFDLRTFWHVAYGSALGVPRAVRERGEAALASAGAVIFEADATRQLYVQHGDPGRFVTLPYGIDVEEIGRYMASVSRPEARRRLKLPSDATIFLCLGTVEPRKAQGALAAAFRKVAREHPEAFLVFVGAGSDEPSRGLKTFARASGLANRVKIVATTPDVNVWYRASDALVCASDVESLPRTVLEAMAFSVPVIATRVFGLPELIEDGVTGYLCGPRDIGELVGVLSRFLEATRERREAVGVAGMQLVRERHDSRQYADAYERLLRSLIEDPRRLPGEVLSRP